MVCVCFVVVVVVVFVCLFFLRREFKLLWPYPKVVVSFEVFKVCLKIPNMVFILNSIRITD